MTRITLDLTPGLATQLHRWISRTAVGCGPGPFLSEDEVILAMVVTCLRYRDVGDQVAVQLRHQRAAGPERGRG